LFACVCTVFTANTTIVACVITTEIHHFLAVDADLRCSVILACFAGMILADANHTLGITTAPMRWTRATYQAVAVHHTALDCSGDTAMLHFPFFVVVAMLFVGTIFTDEFVVLSAHNRITIHTRAVAIAFATHRFGTVFEVTESHTL